MFSYLTLLLPLPFILCTQFDLSEASPSVFYSPVKRICRNWVFVWVFNAKSSRRINLNFDKVTKNEFVDNIDVKVKEKKKKRQQQLLTSEIFALFLLILSNLRKICQNCTFAYSIRVSEKSCFLKILQRMQLNLSAFWSQRIKNSLWKKK